MKQRVPLTRGMREKSKLPLTESSRNWVQSQLLSLLTDSVLSEMLIRSLSWVKARSLKQGIMRLFLKTIQLVITPSLWRNKKMLKLLIPSLKMSTISLILKQLEQSQLFWGKVVSWVKKASRMTNWKYSKQNYMKNAMPKTKHKLSKRKLWLLPKDRNSNEFLQWLNQKST